MIIELQKYILNKKHDNEIHDNEKTYVLGEFFVIPVNPQKTIE